MALEDTQSLDCPSSILVLQLCPIGDTMFGTPALRALRRRFPKSEITVMMWQSSVEVLRGNPNIDRIITCQSTLDMARTAKQLRGAHFDLVVGLSHVGSWLSAAFSRSHKVGFNSTHLGWMYSEAVPDKRTIHAIDYCLHVVKSLGAEPDSRKIEFYISDEDINQAEEFLDSYDIKRKPGLIAIHPGGKNFTAKRWSPLGFAKVANELINQFDTDIVIIGGNDDLPLAHEIVRNMTEEPIIAAGKLSLKQTGALISKCDLFIGNDSAPQHIASAVNTPVITLFGPTDPSNFGPTASCSRVVRADMSCSPCFHWMASPLQYLYLSSVKKLECKHECMAEIQPGDVVRAVESILVECSEKVSPLRQQACATAALV